jgi:hypothetical protein
MTELRQRQPRIRDEGYLKWLRQQRCGCGCGKTAPSDAAHLRAANLKYGKEFTGACKPHDFWAMPLNRGCHMRQHESGDELSWWAAHGVPDPFGRAMRYYAAYQAERPTEPAGKGSVSKPRKPKTRAKSHHEPRAGHPATKKRAKIASRPFPKDRKFRT